MCPPWTEISKYYYNGYNRSEASIFRLLVTVFFMLNVLALYVLVEVVIKFL